MHLALQNFVYATKACLSSRGLEVPFTFNNDVDSKRETAWLQAQMDGLACELQLAAELTQALMGSRINAISVNLTMDRTTNLPLTFDPDRHGLKAYVMELPGALDALHKAALRGIRSEAGLSLLQAELNDYFGGTVPTELISKEEKYIVADKYVYTARMNCLDIRAGTFGPGGFRIVCDKDEFGLLHYGEGKFTRENAEKILELTQVLAKLPPEVLIKRRDQVLQEAARGEPVETSLELM